MIINTDISNNASINNVEGVLFVDKPKWMTSNDVVQIVKGGVKTKVGHCGTLDPFATGLLILCIGSATKYAKCLTELDKEYEASIVLGESRDTDDVTGKILNVGALVDLTEEIKNNIINKFTGLIIQNPPKYSAIKINGVRAYKMARKGYEFSMPSRNVNISNLEIHQIKKGHIHMRVSCSKGTYIRSLARDIGLFLNTYGYLETLRRTRIGSIDMDTQDMHSRLFNRIISSDIIPVKEFMDNFSMQAR